MVEISDPTFDLENEELILRNTYVNAQLLSTLAPLEPTVKDGPKGARVQWLDNKPEGKQEIATVISDKESSATVIAAKKPADLKPIMKAGVTSEP